MNNINAGTVGIYAVIAAMAWALGGKCFTWLHARYMNWLVPVRCARCEKANRSGDQVGTECVPANDGKNRRERVLIWVRRRRNERWRVLGATRWHRHQHREHQAEMEAEATLAGAQRSIAIEQFFGRGREE